ncbi:MAG: DNA polymerase III subunit gamma/tau [Deltaproteobacteria bacterium]|nr:DNA polymerase III subunit gamma/tau [Deltaproteobacteria bacterium]
MSYLVLARKWRPQTFADLVGQEHVVQTLHNAITQDRLSHAFLFTGARGVGKTTIARILARSLNCLASDRVTATPCLKCAACLEIADGRDPDVQEIDGASNNGVDDVRRLQETLPYRPLRDRYKVVIIDECHMVSTNGWNALLKTLEEPPPHVKFIFATTEVHKVIPTILSRVQRYDFRLLPTKQIRDRVAYILTQEGIRFDEDAVMLVAREAAGSLRDALTFLDQVLAGVEGELTGVAASRLLGIANRGLLDTLVRAMLTGDASAALETVGMFAREGFDLPNAARRVLGVLRDLVVARVAKDPDSMLDLVDEERAQAMALAKQHDPADLQRLFTAWAKVTEDVSRASEPRWVLEMAAVRLASRPTLVPVEELMAKLLEMERRVAASAAAPGSAPARPSSGGSGPTGGGAPTPTVQRPGPPARWWCSRGWGNGEVYHSPYVDGCGCGGAGDGARPGDGCGEAGACASTAEGAHPEHPEGVAGPAPDGGRGVSAGGRVGAGGDRGRLRSHGRDGRLEARGRRGRQDPGSGAEGRRAAGGVGRGGAAGDRPERQLLPQEAGDRGGAGGDPGGCGAGVRLAPDDGAGAGHAARRRAVHRPPGGAREAGRARREGGRAASAPAGADRGRDAQRRGREGEARRRPGLRAVHRVT